MKKHKLLLSSLFFSLFSTYAQAEFSLRFAQGVATTSTLSQVVLGNIGTYPLPLRVDAVDVSYKIANTFFSLPLKIYMQGGVAQFHEYSHDDINELVLYIKAYYAPDILSNIVRFGAGEGGSYTYGTLEIEKREAFENDGKNSNYLNYIDLSIDANIGKFFRYKALDTTRIGFALKHRSGIFGLINNVKRGGSNYTCFYLESFF